MVNKWTRNVLGRWLPSACALCGAEARGGPVCGQCLDDLPRLGSACVRCGVPLPSAGLQGSLAGTPVPGVTLCGSCLREPPPLARCVAALEFRDTARALVHGLKFRGQLPFARPLGEVVARSVAERGPVEADLLLPVPLHPGRLRQRGFNQATEVARVVSRLLGMPLASPGTATRRRSTVAQTDLPGARARRRNVAGAFQVDSREVSGRRVVLLDDVMTTGATLYELARTVGAAGARQVEAWACCRAGPPHAGPESPQASPSPGGIPRGGLGEGLQDRASGVGRPTLVVPR